jgi:hypothetical protein
MDDVTHNSQGKRNRRAVIMLFLIAGSFYAGFIVLTALKT